MRTASTYGLVFLTFGLTCAASQAQQPHVIPVSLATRDYMPSIRRWAVVDLPACDAPVSFPPQTDVEIMVDASGGLASARMIQPRRECGAFEHGVMDALNGWSFHAAENHATPPAPFTSIAIARISVDTKMKGAPKFGVTLVAPPHTPLGAPDPLLLQMAYNSSRGALHAVLSRSPSVRRAVQQSYTPGAIAAKIRGTVLVEVIVLPDGTVGAEWIGKSLDG
jgi:hypothetical protein